MQNNQSTQSHKSSLTFVLPLLFLVSSFLFAELSLAVTPKVLLSQKSLSAAEMMNLEYQARIERELKIRKLQEYLLARGVKSQKNHALELKSSKASEATVKP